VTAALKMASWRPGWVPHRERTPCFKSVIIFLFRSTFIRALPSTPPAVFVNWLTLSKAHSVFCAESGLQNTCRGSSVHGLPANMIMIAL
jgi:hypothetical protein